MGYFKRVSAQLSRKELEMLKQGRKTDFERLSLDRQGEILTMLPFAFMAETWRIRIINVGKQE